MQIIPVKHTQAEVATIIKTTVTTAKQRGVVNTSSSEMPAGTNVKSAKTQAKKKRTTTRTPIAFVVVVSVFFSVLIVQRDEPKQTDVDCDHDDDGPVGDTRRHVGDEAVIQRTS